MSTEDDEVLKEFLVESHEGLDALDRDFVALEKDPDDRSRIGGIFRAIHTIKGTSGFLAFTKLEALAHAGESLLSLLRDGVLSLTPEITSGLLAMVDGVRGILTSVERTGEEGSADYSQLIEELHALAKRPGGPEPARAKPSAVTFFSDPAPSPPSASTPAGDAPSGAPPTKNDAAPPVAATTPEPAKVEPAKAEPAKAEPAKADSPPPKKAPAPEASAPAESRDARPAITDTSIRVDVGLLDKLMNLVGELVLARNQILQYGATAKDTAFVGTTQRLNLITTELQEGVMKTRMQPIGNIWSKLPRVVRDLAVTCGKQASIELEGADTELDRSIIEAIKDPLTHVVRNAVDHGIEPADKRVAAGKPANGTLKLRAFHEGGKVNIEISDDGGGIDPAKVRDKALSRGLITPDRASRMSERELLSLIFLPGFSTAEKVSAVSGRGVGMDVVKTNVEKIGGTVDIQSAVGKGTSLRIKIPLTLAIIPALVVTSRGDRYAIPQVNLLELVRLDAEQAKRGIEHIQGAPVHRLRGHLLPLVRLDAALETSARDEADGELYIVVLQADDRQFGLVVDEVLDTEEIVVKPLGKELKALTVYAGATIMGDGRVALILDVLGIAQRSNVINALRERALRESAGDARDVGEQKEAMLLFSLESGDRMALPLEMVARLEEFQPRVVERVGACHVVQYRGQIMPLLPLDEILSGAASTASDDGAMQVIVTQQGGLTVGLVVKEILDIVEETITVRTNTGMRSGVLGAAVLQGRVTELLDVGAALRRVAPSIALSGA